MRQTVTESEMIALLEKRDEEAIAELEHACGDSCMRVARNILGSERDAEECVSDAYLAAWNAIPPARPDSLRAWLLRVTRNLALKRSRYNTAGRRAGEYDAALDELSELLPAQGGVEDELDARELAAALNLFLDELDRTSRICFVRRFWYADSVDDIARALGMRPNTVSARLRRIRQRLHAYLMKEGFLP